MIIFWYFHVLVSWKEILDIWTVVKKDKLFGKKEFPKRKWVRIGKKIRGSLDPSKEGSNIL